MSTRLGRGSGLLLLGGGGSWNWLINRPQMALALRPDRGVFANAAAYFTAANKEYLTIAHASQSGLDLSTTDFSISVWAKRASTGASQIIVCKREDSNNDYFLDFQADDTLIFAANIGGAQKVRLITTSTFTSTTSWYHIVVVVSRGVSAAIYVDGVSQTLGTNTNPDAVSLSNTGPFYVGTFDATQAFMNGAIDSLMISTGGRLYTQAEVTWLYNSGKGRVWDDMANAADPVAVGLNDSFLKSWWELGEADGANRADSKGSNTLTPTGADLVTNGTFTGNSTGWTEVVPEWAYGTNNEAATLATGDVEQTLTGNVQSGKIYRLTYTITRTAGTVTPKIGGTSGTARSSSLTVTDEEISGGSTNELLEFTGAGFSGTLDTVSCYSKGPSRVAGIQSTFQIDSDGDPVGNWLDQTTNARLFTQATISKRPLWKANIWGTNPGVLFDGTDDLLVVASAFLTGQQGAVVALVRLTAAGDAEYALISSADDGSTNDYVIADARRENALNNKILVGTAVSGTTHYVLSTTAPTSATNYIMSYLSNGSSWSIRLNRINESLTIGVSNSGNWFGDPLNKDNVVIGALKLTSEQAFLSGYIGPLFVLDGRYPSNRELAAMEQICTDYANGVRI